MTIRIVAIKGSQSDRHFSAITAGTRKREQQQFRFAADGDRIGACYGNGYLAIFIVVTTDCIIERKQVVAASKTATQGDIL